MKHDMDGNRIVKRKTRVAFPEMQLPRNERRRRARAMAKIGIGVNALTKRQIRRLPSRSEPSKAAARKERRQLRRYARQQGISVAALLA